MRALRFSDLLRILIVEDRADGARSMELVQRHLGHDVRVARDGREAADAVKGWTPAVVLLDIGLPGMDGWRVAEQLWPVGSEDRPLLIAVTGYGTEEHRRKSAA